jgi:hypothetical protein
MDKLSNEPLNVCCNLCFYCKFLSFSFSLTLLTYIYHCIIAPPCAIERCQLPEAAAEGQHELEKTVFFLFSF